MSSAVVGEVHDAFVQYLRDVIGRLPPVAVVTEDQVNFAVDLEETERREAAADFNGR